MIYPVRCEPDVQIPEAHRQIIDAIRDYYEAIVVEKDYMVKPEYFYQRISEFGESGISCPLSALAMYLNTLMTQSVPIPRGDKFVVDPPFDSFEQSLREVLLLMKEQEGFEEEFIDVINRFPYSYILETYSRLLQDQSN